VNLEGESYSCMILYAEMLGRRRKRRRKWRICSHVAGRRISSPVLNDLQIELLIVRRESIMSSVATRLMVLGCGADPHWIRL